MSMLQFVCEKCGFQAFVETPIEATGWHFKTADSPSLCTACMVDMKPVEAVPPRKRERAASAKA
jgi:hypothetical protein